MTCDVINQEMSRDTYKDFHLIRKVKQLLTETGMVGKSYFNHRRRKVSKISAGGRLRKNNQALSYLRLLCCSTLAADGQDESGVQLENLS